MPAQQAPQYTLSETGRPLDDEVQESIFGYKPVTTEIFMQMFLANKWRDVIYAEDVYQHYLSSSWKEIQFGHQQYADFKKWWLILFLLQVKKKLSFNFQEEKCFLTV